MNWKFFVGACILAGGLAVKFGAPPVTVVAGIALAGVLSWTRQRGVVKHRKD